MLGASGSVELGYKCFYYIPDDEKVVSGASAELSDLGGIWYFNRLYVVPTLRGKGIARTLVAEVVRFVKENNICLVCDINAYGDLSVEQLKSFYIKHGFQEVNGRLVCGDLVYKAKNCVVCGTEMVWEHPDIDGHYMTSSSDIENWNICYECMVEHCIHTECSTCEYRGISDVCRFEYIKCFYTEG